MKEGPSAEMAASVTDAMKKASASLEQMQSTLGTYQKLAEPSGNLGHDLTRTLGEVDSAAPLGAYADRVPRAPPRSGAEGEAMT